jgi:tRNA A37 threonylcarbamoyladenosine biosynthesis protein TsaE
LVHVDAYRLTDSRDLDDLDIDFDGSVVVVEWAAGMLEGINDSWLEIAIERPRGVVAATDDSEDSEAGIEPRLVQVRGFGPRWANLDWLEHSPWRA